VHAFRDVATAAYCPRKLYYRRREPDPGGTPPEVERVRDLAFRYDRLLRDDGALDGAPIAVTPTQFRSHLGTAKARLDDPVWEGLVDPDGREVLLAGRECRGVAHKIVEDGLASGGPTLSLVFAGDPPRQGVWEPQSVRLVAAAKALSWERETAVERVFAEYPAHGAVRGVELTTRRKAAYREAVRTAEAIDGPPARVDSDAKCAPCEFSDECGTRTRSLRSLLGGG
jgi:CRISPR-associated exonuclease Cas4